MPSLSFHFPLPLLLLLFCTFLFFSSAMHSFHDDRQSLLAFKNLITKDPHDAMADWNDTNIPISNWTGVTCSRRHPNRVLALNLTSMDLYGPISPFLGNLSFLRSLVLSENALHGRIPTQLGRLSRLRTLLLDNNQLEGHVPTQLSGCKNLVSLLLSFNNLNGNIPRELGSLTHLQYLLLGNNILTGFLALKGAKEHANGDKETAKVALRVYREVVHSLDDLPRDFHPNSELQQLSPPSLKAANGFYRNSSLTFNWTAKLH